MPAAGDAAASQSRRDGAGTGDRPHAGARPGRPVRGSGTGRPLMALFDLVGRQWNLRIIWELHRAARPLTFRELRSACGDVSSSVLTQRLHELADTRITTHTGDGYALPAPAPA